MTLNEYQQDAMRTGGDRPATEARVYGAMAISGEAGEYSELIKKAIFHLRALVEHDAALELGDILWGVAYAARSIGYSLEDVAALNIEKLSARYPSGYVHGGGVR